MVSDGPFVGVSSTTLEGTGVFSVRKDPTGGAEGLSLGMIVLPLEGAGV